METSCVTFQWTVHLFSPEVVKFYIAIINIYNFNFSKSSPTVSICTWYQSFYPFIYPSWYKVVTFVMIFTYTSPMTNDRENSPCSCRIFIYPLWRNTHFKLSNFKIWIVILLLSYKGSSYILVRYVNEWWVILCLILFHSLIKSSF